VPFMRANARTFWRPHLITDVRPNVCAICGAYAVSVGWTDERDNICPVGRAHCSSDSHAPWSHGITYAGDYTWAYSCSHINSFGWPHHGSIRPTSTRRNSRTYIQSNTISDGWANSNAF
jgi:hypothetical protein